LKRENVVSRALKNKVKIADREVTEIYFDLKHIQHGWDPVKKDYSDEPARNSYSEEDIVELFEQLNTLIQTPVAQKTNLSSVAQRYVFYIYDDGKRLKIVVDLMKNESTVVVTIH
jgi:hypothetical protein